MRALSCGRRSVAAVGFFVALFFGGASLLAAEPSKQSRAKALFEAGNSAYKKARYRVAAEAFEEAYRLTPHPALAFSMAQAYRRLFFVDFKVDHARRALELYQAYVDRISTGGRRSDAVEQIQSLSSILSRLGVAASGAKPGSSLGGRVSKTQLMVHSPIETALASIDGGAFVSVPRVQNVEPGEHKVVVKAPGFRPKRLTVAAVEGRLVPLEAKLEAQPATLSFHVSEEAKVNLDGRSLGTTPLAGPVSVPPGLHRIVVTQSGRVPFSTEMVFARGRHRDLEVNLETTMQRRVAHYTLATAGALLLGGLVSGGLALNFERKAKNVRAPLFAQEPQNLSAADLSAYERHVSHRNTSRTLGVALLSGAGVMALVGFFLYFVDTPTVPLGPPSRASTAPEASERRPGLSPEGIP